MLQRDERIIALLQQELSALMRTIKDPGVDGLVTITDVSLSRDRKTARVFYSVLGNETQRRSTAKALDRAAQYLRYQLKSRLTLRIIPHIEFEYDKTPERAQRIEAILGQLSAEAPPPPQNGPAKRNAPPDA